MMKGKYQYLPFAFAALLFIIPFFWYWGGVVDWGGDSTRIYYLFPKLYILNHALFGVSPSDTGGQIVAFYSLPYLCILVFLRTILDASAVIGLTNGVKLSLAFLFVYLTVREFLITGRKFKAVTIMWASFLTGILYVFSPVSTIGWDKVILTHDQFFLNPLMFYLLLRFFHSSRILYLLLAVFISFFFSFNFSFVAAPPLFAFYPLTFVFLFLYQKMIRKKPLYISKLCLALVLFLLIQSFHLIPLLLQMFQPGSVSYTNIFSAEGKFDRGLSYFVAIAKVVRVSTGIFLQPQLAEVNPFNFYTIMVPTAVVLSLALKKSKLVLLTAVIFLITLYFATANITHAGTELYKSFFSMPGFSMFRNFFGQWNYAYLFFYSILFGLSFYYLFASFRWYYDMQNHIFQLCFRCLNSQT